MADWVGPPRANGVVHDLDLDSFFLLFDGEEPILVIIESTEDDFLPIFSTVEKVAAYLRHLIHLGCPEEWVKGLFVRKVDKQSCGTLLAAFLEHGVRVMVDPVVVSDNHTKWLEVVFEEGVPAFLKANGAPETSFSGQPE
jgi:hypothetical protein